MRNQLIIGDALTKLRELDSDSIDVGVTSPPYNKQEKQKGWLVKNVVYDSHRDAVPEADYQHGQIAVLNELHRVTKPGGSFFYNHKTRWNRGEMMHPMMWLAKTDWTIRQEIIWDRQIAANIRGWRFWQVDERIYWLIKPVGDNKIGEELEARHAKLTSVWRFSPERNNPHPAPFPLTLPVRAIASVLKEKGKVIDPYCGSGTTLMAAKLLGHNYVGIDISPSYIEMTEKRLQNSESEFGIAEAELMLHKVNGTFTERKQSGANVGKFSPQRNGKKERDDFNLTSRPPAPSQERIRF